MHVTAFTEDELEAFALRVVRLGVSLAMAEKVTPEIMTKKEVADYLRVSVATIDRQMKSGLPYFNVGESGVRFRNSEIDEHLSRERVQTI